MIQAEDGIRDGRVTGVQTCALPICAASLPLGNDVARGVDAYVGKAECLKSATELEAARLFVEGWRGYFADGDLVVDRPCVVCFERSEERRVGKGRYSRWWSYDSSRRRHTRWTGDWSSDVCSSDLRRLPSAQQ